MNNSDPTPPAPTPDPTPAAPQAHGYFNQGQLDDIAEAEAVETAARSYPDEMTDQDITPLYLDGFLAAIAEARRRASASGQDADDSKHATALANSAAAALLAALQKIQKSAKQKHKMLAEDGDPETNFSTDGYLIGTRLDASRTTLIQSATTLIARATQDSLPGFKTPEKITAVSTLLTAYQRLGGDHQEATRDKELSRLNRDDLMHVLNTRRAAIQHAADAIWPPSDLAHRPIRKSFHLPLTRALGL